MPEPGIVVTGRETGTIRRGAALGGAAATAVGASTLLFVLLSGGGGPAVGRIGIALLALGSSLLLGSAASALGVGAAVVAFAIPALSLIGAAEWQGDPGVVLWLLFGPPVFVGIAAAVRGPARRPALAALVFLVVLVLVLIPFIGQSQP